jgi:UDP-N-acetylmuramoyl-tripeptide--D-alanyl-D-alanine ligase
MGELAEHSATAYGVSAVHVADIHVLQQQVMALLPSMGSVLVKGSRFMKMERVIETMQAACANVNANADVNADPHVGKENKKESTPCC